MTNIKLWLFIIAHLPHCSTIGQTPGTLALDGGEDEGAGLC